MQEFEPETWDKLTERSQGANTAGQLREDFYCPAELPFMFKDWREYRDYLLENIIPNEGVREKLRRLIQMNDERYNEEAQEALIKQGINVILNHEFEGSKFSVFVAGHGRMLKNAFARNRS